MKTTSKPIVYAALVLSTVFWGISFIMTKELFLSEEHMTVTILITLRLAVATAVMMPALALARKLERIRRGDLKWFLLLALAEPFIYNLCETSGVQLVSGSLASVIVATIPLFVPFGMWIGYRKRIGLPLLIGVVLSLTGVFVMLIGGEGLRGNARGLLFLSGAVFIAVVYTLILVKIVDHYHPVTITTYQNFIGLVYYLPLMLLTDGSQLPLLSWSPKMLLLLLILGVCCSTLAYVFYNLGVRSLGASEACIFNNAIPVFSLLAAVLIGQESFSWTKVAGMAIVITGVVLAQWKERPPKTQ
jgi:drug/metabolite transporter (DMT)-like permease